ASGSVLAAFLLAEYFFLTQNKNPNTFFDLSKLLRIEYVIIPIFTAVVEETFFRGFLLNRWLDKFSKPIFPMVLSTIMFTAFHLPYVLFDLRYSGIALATYIILNLVSGFANVLLFYSSRSVYSSITSHFLWNFFVK